MHPHPSQPIARQRIEPSELVTAAEAARSEREARYMVWCAGAITTWIVVHVAGWL